MAQRNCKICGTVFYTKPSHIKLGWGLYCSMLCKGQDEKNGKTVECAICKKAVYRTAKELRKTSVTKKFFCNKSCFAVWKNKNMFVGSGHPGWKDGPSSYRAKLLRSGRIAQCEFCELDDIRALVAHHRDSNRKNNALSNLIWLCHNCHYLLHGRKIV